MSQSLESYKGPYCQTDSYLYDPYYKKGNFQGKLFHVKKPDFIFYTGIIIMARQALFEGLVYDEFGNLATTAMVGDDAHYVVDDQGFLRHISAEEVDRQVLAIFMEQLQDNKEIAVEQMMNMMGKDDLFTKAAIDASLRNIDIDQIVAQGIPEQARNMMGMVGLRIFINHHGEVIKLDQPAAPDDFE